MRSSGRIGPSTANRGGPDDARFDHRGNCGWNEGGRDGPATAAGFGHSRSPGRARSILFGLRPALFAWRSGSHPARQVGRLQRRAVPHRRHRSQGSASRGGSGTSPPVGRGCGPWYPASCRRSRSTKSCSPPARRRSYRECQWRRERRRYCRCVLWPMPTACGA